MKNKLSFKELTDTQRVKFLEKELSLKLKNIPTFSFTQEQVAGKNIENLIGATQIPLGIAGPLKIKDLTSNKTKEYFIPLATTEGALVASVSRGCKVTYLSGGVTTLVEKVGMTRGPVFATQNLNGSLHLKKWIEENFLLLSKITKHSSNHLKLIKSEVQIIGKNVFIRFYFDSEDAMGMNIATFATEEIARVIAAKTKSKLLSLAGNFDIDKKPSWLNFIKGRGRKVWGELTISKKVVMDVLKTTPEKIAEVTFQKCQIGSALSGSLGFNAHFANIIAAIFAATGQDLAHIVDGSLGITTAEVLKNGDLYFSIYLPSLIIGTVGGGTKLPTQNEALEILGVSGNGKVDEFAKIISGVVLAGELSLIASLAENSLSRAHLKLGRNQR